MERLHEGVRYSDPFAAARRAVAALRSQGCSLVVCLSHLGYVYREPDRPSDTRLAQEVEGIDLILGGHTHTFLDRPDVHRHADRRQTVVTQVGFAGMRLGRIDVVLGPASVFGESEPPPGAGSGAPGCTAPLHRPLRWSGGSYRVDARLD